MKTPLRKFQTLLAGAALVALGAITTAHADYSSTVVSQSPVGYWRLNETIQPQNIAGAANLGSLGASGLGTYNNFPTRGLPGPFAGSSAIGFDGSSSYVSTPGSAGLNGNAFTFEIWASPDVVPKFAYLASAVDFAANRSGWYFAQDDGSVFGAGSAWVVRFFNLNAANYTVQYAAPVTNAPGTWAHLVLTYDGSVGALYMNGVLITNRAAAYVPTTTRPFTVGCRSTLNFHWPGKAAEVAMYPAALSADRVAAHYSTAQNNPAGYQAAVMADSPVLYHRYQEPIDPPADNLGSLGNAGDGLYIYNTQAGVAGPSSPPYLGFEAANKAAGFNGGGGVVRLPALNLNTNRMTISGWFKPTGSQPVAAGLVICNSGTTTSGLTIDQVYGGLGLGYIWNGNNYGISPSSDFGLPTLPDGKWAFAALAIEPTKATLYICDETKYDNWASMENTFNVNHAVQAFAGPTLIGAQSGFTTRNFNGSADEVAIFNRTLSAGELYTQYASAVGGVPPRVFTFMEGPTEPIPAGDSIVLRVDAGGTPPLNYTWTRGGTTVSNTTSGVLTIPNSTLADTGFYEVTITNAHGNALGSGVFVTVVTPSAPAITATEGFKDRTLYPTATLRLSVTATGGGLKYQWYRNGASISGATTSAYVVPSVTNTHAGNYSVLITNALGSLSNGPVAIAVATPASGSYAAAIVGSNPRAWWRLGEAPGTTNLFDAMGRHDGYYINISNNVPPVTLGAPGAIIGDPNTAVSFSRNGGLGVIPYSDQLNPTVFTYEAWVRTPITDNTDMVPVSSCDSSLGNWWRTFPAGLWSPQGNTGYAPIYDNGNAQAVVLSNVWTHLVMTYDPSRVSGGTTYPWTYFVNGVTDGYIWTGASPNTSAPFLIGGRGRTGNPIADFFFNGQVDEVAVYQRVLPASEIQAHYAARGVEIIPPSFTTALLSQTVTAGKTVVFTTGVLGTSPALQWLKDGSPIDLATNATLTLGNVSTGDQGTYTLRASNSAGTNTLTATLVVLSPVSYANVTNDLVLHLRFDGNAADSSGRNNNGTPSASPAPTYVAGKIGPQALQYVTMTNAGGAVSSASYVTLGTPTDLRFGAATSFSVGLWVKLSSGNLDGDLPFIGNATNSMNNPGWALGPSYKQGGWQFCLNDGVNNLDVNGPNNSINDGNWHNFVVVVDRAAKLALAYLDGLLVASRDITTLGSVDNNNVWPIVIGQDPTFLYNEAGSAIVDDIGVWRRALAPADVAKIESAGRIGGRSFDTVAPVVTLTITRSGADLTLGWSAGTLLQSDTLGEGAVWMPVPGASAPSHTLTPGGTNKYYRVVVE